MNLRWKVWIEINSISVSFHTIIAIKLSNQSWEHYVYLSYWDHTIVYSENCALFSQTSGHTSKPFGQNSKLYCRLALVSAMTHGQEGSSGLIFLLRFAQSWPSIRQSLFSIWAFSFPLHFFSLCSSQLSCLHFIWSVRARIHAFCHD